MACLAVKSRIAWSVRACEAFSFSRFSLVRNWIVAICAIIPGDLGELGLILSKLGLVLSELNLSLRLLIEDKLDDLLNIHRPPK